MPYQGCAFCEVGTPEVGLEPTTKRSEAQGEGGAGQAAGRVVQAQPAGRVQGGVAGLAPM